MVKKIYFGKVFSFLTTFLLLTQSTFAQTPRHQLENAVVERIATGFRFLEGPLWVDTLGLLFSDIPANTVYRYTPEDSASVYLTPSGNSNGLKLDLDGSLLLAQHGKRRIARIVNGVEDSVVERYQGKRLNSPNDLVVKSTGSIFFTDPPYGIQAGQSEQGFNGIYSVTPNGHIHLLDATLSLPNGIVFSPNERKLYVNNTTEKAIYRWDVVNDSTLANKTLFASVAIPNVEGNADGITIDEQGILYSTGASGVWVIDSLGKVLDTIQIAERVTNLTFGGPDRSILYVTGAAGSLFSVRSDIIVTGVNDKQSNQINATLGLIYPNPATDRIFIPVSLREQSTLKVSVRNAQGNEVAVVANETLAKGDYQFQWEKGSVQPGLYFVHFVANDAHFAKPFVVK